MKKKWYTVDVTLYERVGIERKRYPVGTVEIQLAAHNALEARVKAKKKAAKKLFKENLLGAEIRDVVDY